MSERKNIKRNANRVKASERPYHSSIQHNYNKKRIQQELTLSLFK